MRPSLCPVTSLILGAALWVTWLLPRTACCAERLRFLNYPNCILLASAHVRVVLCPDAGGRVLEYSLDGINALHLDPAEAAWQPGAGNWGIPVSAGRFDIGPEQVIPPHPELWSGVWAGEITGPHSARLTSPRSAATGVQLVREFELGADNSRLRCRQIIRNVSDRTVQWCHWSRTFGKGGGIVWIPLTLPSRFPNSYVMYEGRNLLNFRPEDPQVHERDGFLEILGPPAFPKMGMDSTAGWFAHQQRSGLLFIKRYPVFPERMYNEVAGLTVSIWYPQTMPVVELEPIGPRERLAPGQCASFVEDWWLLPNAFPRTGETVDLRALRRRIETETQPPQ